MSEVQNTGNGLHRCGKWAMARWVMRHHILYKSICGLRQELLTSATDYNSVGGSLQISLGLLCWMDHCKLSVNLFGLIAFIQWGNISILMGVVFSRMTLPCTGNEGPVNGWMRMKTILYAMAFTTTRSQSKRTLLGDFGQACCTAHYTANIKAPIEGMPFGRYPTSMPSCTEAVQLVVARRFTETIRVALSIEL